MQAHIVLPRCTFVLCVFNYVRHSAAIAINLSLQKPICDLSKLNLLLIKI